MFASETALREAIGFETNRIKTSLQSSYVIRDKTEFPISNQGHMIQITSGS